MLLNDIICFLILHYNTIEMTHKCVDSIFRLVCPENMSIHIVIVDNASPDKSGEQLAKEYEHKKGITVLLNERNSGFSSGNNIGYRYIKGHMSCRYLIVANNDICFCQANMIEKIKELDKQYSYDILGPDILNSRTGKHQNPLAYNPPTIKQVSKTIHFNRIALVLYPVLYPLLRQFFRDAGKEKENNQYEKVQEDVCLMGACLILSEKFILNRKLIFEPETEFYYEEFLISLWAKKNRKKLLYSPVIQVLHEEGAATGKERSEWSRIKFRVKNTYKAAKIYLRELKRME